MVMMPAQQPVLQSRNSAERVFDIAELLEDILLYDEVDMKTVLLSQKVSKSFKMTIDGSPKLLRKLWMLPVATRREKIEANPLVFSRRMQFFGPWGSFALLKRTEHDCLVRIDLHVHYLAVPPKSWDRMLIWRMGENKKNTVCKISLSGVPTAWNRGKMSIHLGKAAFEGTPTAGEIREVMQERTREMFPRMFDADGKFLGKSPDLEPDEKGGSQNPIIIE